MENGIEVVTSRESSRKSTAERPFKGIRMSKWGKWVAEIREPNKRSRILLGSYSTPIATARAYDTEVFYLRDPSARLNFPDLLAGEKFSDGGGDLSASSIRKKAIEVGARVDALEAAQHHHHHHHYRCHYHHHHYHHNYNHGYHEESKANTGGFLHRIDLNKIPDPEESDIERKRK